MRLLARKFENLTVKRTECGDWRTTFKLDAIKLRMGLRHADALAMQETLAAYETSRDAAEDTALAMAREWQLARA